MHQSALAFDTELAVPADRVGFQIGWDHAHHALVPPPELLWGNCAIGQGWRAARAVFGDRTLRASRHVRAWLGLRIRAWREAVPFEGTLVTPNYLAQIDARICPVTRRALGGAADAQDAPVTVRLREDASYAAGNLAVVSARVADAKAGLSLGQLRALAESAKPARAHPPQPTSSAIGSQVAGPEAPANQQGLSPRPAALDPGAWARLATLVSFATEQPHVLALRMPLRLLPPNRVRVLNASQGLQVVLTLRLSAPGWSRRARAIADLLPEPGLRHDFNLFVGALAARLMGIPADASPRDIRCAQEDAWADVRVQRRWRQFVGQMSAEQTELLLHLSARSGLAGVRLMVHERDRAVEGWAMGARWAEERAPGNLPTVAQRDIVGGGNAANDSGEFAAPATRP